MKAAETLEAVTVFFNKTARISIVVFSSWLLHRLFIK